MNKWILFGAIALLFGCKGHESLYNNTHKSTLPKYAKGFWVEEFDNYRDVFVKQSTDSTAPLIHYRLINKVTSDTLMQEQGTTVIQVPVSSIVCTSTTHIPLLDYLDESEKLIGFPSTKYISSEKMRKRIEGGLVTELGIDNSLNLELLAQLHPSLLMAYSLGNDLGQLKKIQEVGIPVVINAEYLEQHPLGRAEWIKFMALFFGKEKEADSIFNWIEAKYLKNKKLTESFTEQPSVLTGIPYGGIWYLPGGQNYAARFFEDAGCAYLWRDDQSNGFLKLSLETVYERGSASDFWIGVGSFDTYEELKSMDERFKQFAPWQNKKIYNYNKRIGPTGGNEYLELGYLRPDLVLMDLIQITHPVQFPNPDLFFYKGLK